MNILIADDHMLLRQGLKQILADEFAGARLVEAESTPKTIEHLGRERWDLLILDIFMPGRNGLEVLREARQNQPDLPVLVLSSAPEEQLALRVLKAGASGYLNKQTASENLVLAVKKLLQGGKYVSPALAELLATEVTRPTQLPHENLSDREFQVLRLLVAGNTLKEIAAELSLSVKTISTFHIRIWEKLRVRNDVELVHYALDHGLVDRRT
jgi:two-component system, NarL family, invasion response regulator UvrY